MNNEDLIKEAAAVIHPKKVKCGLLADVGSALISHSGRLHLGVSLATGSNVLCAESIAIGAMVAAGEVQIRKIVAVWKNDAGQVHVIAPCGNCRQLMYEVDPSNINCRIVLDAGQEEALLNLLPHYSWWQRQRDF